MADPQARGTRGEVTFTPVPQKDKRRNSRPETQSSYLTFLNLIDEEEQPFGTCHERGRCLSVLHAASSMQPATL